MNWTVRPAGRAPMRRPRPAPRPGHDSSNPDDCAATARRSIGTGDRAGGPRCRHSRSARTRLLDRPDRSWGDHGTCIEEPGCTEDSAVRRLIPHRRFRPKSAPIRIASPGLYPGEPENCRRGSREFLAVLFHLGLLLAVFHVYRVETRSFRVLAMVAAAALPAHYLAPYRWKKPLFVAVSIVGLFLVAGPCDRGRRAGRLGGADRRGRRAGRDPLAASGPC